MTFQRSVGRWLRKRVEGEIYAGQWLEFVDRNGFGFAQPDFFLVRDKSIVLFEAKLTQTEDGYQQLALLYRPLLRHIYRLPVLGILVCKNLVEEPRNPISSPMEVMDLRENSTFTWHLVA